MTPEQKLAEITRAWRAMASHKYTIGRLEAYARLNKAMKDDLFRARVGLSTETQKINELTKDPE